ncbi:hypothetical protein [Chitinibacter sp. S2-10]|uniref:hypothetical protein n=1 Tax=Chitinibacter sp. S2-10 TaxID=3373597 RepID=UPI0039772A10
MKRSPAPYIPPELCIVKTSSAPKLSSRATGRLSYQIGYLPDRSEIYLQLTANEGGGYFSNEWLATLKAW